MTSWTEYPPRTWRLGAEARQPRHVRADASYARDVSDWYPRRPSVPQVVLGAVAFLGLSALFAFWTLDETRTGNVILLRVLAVGAAFLAGWRLTVLGRVVREQRAAPLTPFESEQASERRQKRD